MEISVKRLFYLVLMVTVLLAGCSPAANVAVPVNQPPVAYIDSVSATKITPGNLVTFTGHGEDPDGSIVAYKWWSSIDGDLSDASSFSTASLSEGTHAIWLKVADNTGTWSKEVYANVSVVPLSEMLPEIGFFEVTPQEVGKGQPVILSWEVSNASLVELNQYIGSVPSTGTKEVTPSANTEYTLTASNKNGSVKASSSVTLLAVTTKRVEIYALPAESGHVRSDGVVGPEPAAGVELKVHSGLAEQAFLSYDLSGIPKGKKIKSVYLDVSEAKVEGDPFLYLKTMYAYVCHYKELNKSEYDEGFQGNAIFRADRISNKIFSSTAMTEAVRSAYEAGNSRFQMRMQFALCKCRQMEIGTVDFGGKGSKMVIEYQD